MSFTISSLNTNNYKHNSVAKCRFFRNNAFSASFVWRRDKLACKVIDCMCTFKVSFTYMSDIQEEMFWIYS